MSNESIAASAAVAAVGLALLSLMVIAYSDAAPRAWTAATRRMIAESTYPFADRAFRAALPASIGCLAAGLGGVLMSQEGILRAIGILLAAAALFAFVLTAASLIIRVPWLAPPWMAGSSVPRARPLVPARSGTQIAGGVLLLIIVAVVAYAVGLGALAIAPILFAAAALLGATAARNGKER